MILLGSRGTHSILIMTLDRHLRQGHRRRKRNRRRDLEEKGIPRRRFQMFLGYLGNPSVDVDAITVNNMAKDQTINRTGWARPFLDQVLGGRADRSDLLGINRGWVGDGEADIGDLGLLDNLVEEDGGAEMAAGLEHLTSTFTGCSVG